MTNAAAHGTSPFTIALRALGLAGLAIGVALALVFAFAAALVVGLMIAGAAVAMRFARPKPPSEGPQVLEAHRTPDGWVVETGAKRKS
ncbi:MAG: hypothetical protein R3C16_03645 [Hyphomonadaceae bacterium]